MTILLTAREVQSRLRLGRKAVYALARERKLSSAKIGTRLVFKEAEVEAYVKRLMLPAKRQFLSHSRHPQGL